MLVALLFNLGYPDYVVKYDEKSGIIRIDCAALWRINREDTLFKKYCDRPGADSIYAHARRHVIMTRTRKPPMRKATIPEPPPDVEWYRYPLDGELPFEFKVISTKYIPDTPTTYKQMYGDGDVFVVKNPNDTSVRVHIVWMRIGELDSLVREYWYGDVEEIFFFVKFHPPLEIPPKDARGEIERGLIRLFFLMPDLPLLDTLPPEVRDYSDVRILFSQFCKDTLSCELKIGRYSKGGHIDKIRKPTAAVDFFLAPDDSVVVYVSPIYGR